MAPLLATQGYRVIIPYLRGHGTTHFLSEEIFRNGEQAALARDVIALLDALEIDGPILPGFDWRARNADVVAALWPERCKGLVSVSGYLIGIQEAGRLPLPPAAELQWWYQYYFATDRGLTSGSEKAQEISLTELGLQATSRQASARRAVLRQAASTPKVFGEFYKAYDGRLPPEDMLAKILVSDYEVPDATA